MSHQNFSVSTNLAEIIVNLKMDELEVIYTVVCIKDYIAYQVTW